MKPIAYIDHVSGKPKLIDGYVVQTDYDIPLYTTPQTKPLSDEEIDEIYSQTQGIKMIVNSPALINLLAFARAIEAKVRGEK
jgi:hypothetical protein